MIFGVWGLSSLVQNWISTLCYLCWQLFLSNLVIFNEKSSEFLTFVCFILKSKFIFYAKITNFAQWVSCRVMWVSSWSRFLLHFHLPSSPVSLIHGSLLVSWTFSWLRLISSSHQISQFVVDPFSFYIKSPKICWTSTISFLTSSHYKHCFEF